MSARVIPIAPAVQKRLRQDVLRWARVLHYSPGQSDDPDAIFEFLDMCLGRFPEEYTPAHTGEILRWHAELARKALDGWEPGPEAA